MTTQTTTQKSSIKQLLRTDLGRSVGVTTATQLVWLTQMGQDQVSGGVSVLCYLIKQYEVPLSRMLHDILDDDHLQ